MENSKKTLVVNADDFGLSPGINRGIEKAFRQGILRSTSLMPNGPAYDDALQVAANNPELGVGIHISLVGEQSTASPEHLGGLVNAHGELPPSYMAFVKGYLQRRFSVREIRTEITAQMRRATTTGIHFTHIDSHQHLHMMPGIIDLVAEAAHLANISVIRLPFESGGISPHRCSFRGLQLTCLSLMSRSNSRALRKAGLHSADHFWGLGLSGMLTERPLLRTLARLRPGINEIMCHPGESDSITRETYPWGYLWDEEAAALQAESVKNIIAEKQIQLANFRDAWEVQAPHLL